MVSTVSLLSLCLTLLFALSATAGPVRISKRDSPLSLTLSATGQNAVIAAALTNTGVDSVSILKLGSIFSDAPTHKVDVLSADGTSLPFTGVHLTYDLSRITKDDYLIIPPGGVAQTLIPLSPIFDLTTIIGGGLRISASGVFQSRSPNSWDTPAGTGGAATALLEYESNALALTIDTALIKREESLSTALEKRVVLASCSGARLNALNAALQRVSSRAQAAAQAAASGSASKFNEYFRTTAASARKTVHDRLNAAAKAAASGNSGAVKYYCNDPYGYCNSRVLAWTKPSANIIANCDLYYSSTAQANSCHGQDQWSTSLHEFTHAPGIFSPPTQDYAYGYSAAVALTSSKAILNADTYALYAQAIYRKC